MTRKKKQTGISASKSPDKSVAKPTKPNETKRNRAEYERPKKLGELIDIYNRVPAEINLPDITTNFREKHAELQGNTKHDEYLLELYEVVVKECLEQITANLAEYLKQEAEKKLSLRIVRKAQYAALQVDERHFLKDPGDDNIPTVEKMQKIVDDLDYWFKLFVEFEQFMFLRNDMAQLLNCLNFYRDPNHMFHFISPFEQKNRLKLSAPEIVLTKDFTAVATEGLAAAIVGIKHLDRLRSCVICKKVFWAKRIEARTCDQKCLNAFHQRKRRVKESAEINQKRRENYAYKKKKNGDKKNGTL